ncbi:hypothetical protein AV530_017363 [Patagioenas fasciata monilis]|uniref:Uncharacterized protein n=1 Tax=Patagioenas fasciata monilis TaxID=372326 RepID=A0A1V4JFT5_PATFA|nr:hypothetical protein AV530_017363 [Patagioenas fasciata monilis]
MYKIIYSTGGRSVRKGRRSPKRTMPTLKPSVGVCTVGDLWCHFRHLWISSIKLTAIFHKNPEFGSESGQSR